MPVDAKLQAILDAGKALGIPPIETMTVEEAREERAAMMRRFVPMPEYAGVVVEERTISAGGRSMAVRVYRPGEGCERDIAGGGVLSWWRVCGLYAGDA